MTTRRSLIAGGAVLGLGACTSHVDRDVLTAVDVHPTDYPTVEAVRWIGAELERETGGRLLIREYPGGQLGTETDTVALTHFNVLNFCRVTAAALNNTFPLTQALVVPYTFHTEEHMRRAVDGPVGQEVLASFESRGLIGLALYDGGARSMYTARHAVYEPRDMHGLKVRVPRSDIFLQMLDVMGANPTPIPFGEVFTGLQTHLIDAAENNWSTFQSTRQYEVARYWSQTEHCHSPDVLMFSKARYDAMSPSDRDLLRVKARESVTVMRGLWDEKQARARQIVLDAGVAANTVERAPFLAAVEPVRRRYASDQVIGDLLRRIENEA
ncbi:MAG: TRAP transporter substrate-binding protein [Hyphomonadaceae bacterium]|nr:TRAP transporter substrate-binding protein [Hyphomonadaceae bacterium]